MGSETYSRATIRDVASEAGVSTATVSRVLNDSGTVAPQTRAVVLEVIERRGLTARRRRVVAPRPLRDIVAVRCPYKLDDYFGVILSAVERSLRQAGKVPLLSAAALEGNEPSLTELLRPEITEGAILILPPEPRDALASLRGTGFPFVVVDPRTALPPDVAAVSAAHLTGARMATRYLLQLGHTRIAVIAGPPNWIAADERLLGYRTALAAAGQLAPERLVQGGGEPTIAHGLAAARILLDLPEPPTAIVAFNDKMAIGAMQAAAERGLRVPRDLSVIGFDDLELSTVIAPQLTTVRQPLEEMARLGVQLLLRLIDGREIDTLHVELATELVPRGSTGSAPRLGGVTEWCDDRADDVRGAPRVEAVRDDAEQVPDAQQLRLVPPAVERTGEFLVGGEEPLRGRRSLAPQRGQVDLGPAIGHGRVDQRGTAGLVREDVPRPQVTVGQRRRMRRDQLGERGAEPFQCLPLRLVELRLHQRLRQPPQDPLLREEHVPVGLPAIVLPQTPMPAVALPAEPAGDGGRVQFRHHAAKLLPEPLVLAARPQRLQHEQARRDVEDGRDAHAADLAQRRQPGGLGVEQVRVRLIQRLREHPAAVTQRRHSGDADAPARRQLDLGDREARRCQPLREELNP
jgi:LacI family transcriptional regulator